MDYFPTLYTERLKLRKMEIEDVPSLVQYANNKKVSDYILNIPYPYREPDAAFRMSYVVQGFKKKVRYVFAITLKEENKLIGEISLNLNAERASAEMGYWLGEPFWGRGIVTEAVEVILKFGFEKLNLKHIYASAHPENIGSVKVLLNNQMQFLKSNNKIAEYHISKAAYEE